MAIIAYKEFTTTGAHRCQALAYDPTCFGSHHQCARQGKYQHEGKHYCGTHDPVRKAEKKNRRHKEYEDKWAKKTWEVGRADRFKTAMGKALKALQAGESAKAIAVLDAALKEN